MRTKTNIQDFGNEHLHMIIIIIPIFDYFEIWWIHFDSGKMETIVQLLNNIKFVLEKCCSIFDAS